MLKLDDVLEIYAPERDRPVETDAGRRGAP